MASLRVLPAGGLLAHHPAVYGASQLLVRNSAQAHALPASPISRFQPLRCQHSPPSSPTSHRVHGSLFARPSLALKTSTTPSSSMPPPLATEGGQEETNTLSIIRNTDVDTDVDPGAPCTPSSFPSLFLDAVSQHWKPALACLLISAFLWCTPADNALAAQGGGRAGGNAFSSSRARSYSAPQQSYSAPRSGYSGGAYVAPSPSFSAPFFFAPTPFFSPFAFGPTVVVGGGGGGGFFSLVFFGIVAFFVLSAVLNLWGGSQADEDVWEGEPRSSVVRLQVGLMGTARQLQKDLERMATRADTSTPEGLHYVLQEAVLSLLRNPDYCIYGYSTSEVTRDSYEGEQAFNRLSLEERSKFKEETLVNVGDVRRRIERSSVRETVGSEYIVVTIIAASEGSLRLPEVKSAADLRSALTQLGSITADELQAVEILWTPENEEDTLTTKDMLQDYPLLRPL